MGTRSDSFKISGGLRQGDSLSCYLFLMVVEVLGLMLRNEDLATVNIYDIKKLLGQYADDIWVLMRYNQLTYDRVLRVFEHFRECSGLTVNYDKTEVMRLGSIANTDAKLYSQKGLKWSSGPIKILGVNICNVQSDKPLAASVVSKIVNTIEMWEVRCLTLIGKVLIVNSLLVSKLIYDVLMMANLDTPEYEEIRSHIVKFLWDNKKPKVAYAKLIQSPEK